MDLNNLAGNQNVFITGTIAPYPSTALTDKSGSYTAAQTTLSTSITNHLLPPDILLTKCHDVADFSLRRTPGHN